MPGGPARVLTALAVVALVAGCGDDDSADGTLDVIGGNGTGVTAASAPASDTGVAGTTVPPGEAGAGFVSITVEAAQAGIAETVSLDRSTVAAASLDPVSLDATCTPLDAGVTVAPVEVSVVDLRRLGGDQLVSAVLRYANAGPGEHDMTLELGGTDQVTTTYTGTVSVDETGMAGTFAGTNAAGAEATGSFVCAAEAIATTTTAPPPPVSEPPLDSAPPTSPASTGPTTSTIP